MKSIAILAGGYANRLGKLAIETPKALLPIGDKKFIDYQVERLKAAGLEKLVFCIGHLGEKLREYLGDGSKYDIQIEYSLDGSTPLGTGGAIRKALPLLDEVFFVTYGDTLLTLNYGEALARLGKNDDGVMAVLKNDNRWDQSNVVFSKNRVVAYSKTQKSDDMHFIDYGMSVVRKLSYIEASKNRERFDLAEIFSSWANQGTLAGYEATQRFYEIGTPESLEETRKFLLSGEQTS